MELVKKNLHQMCVKSEAVSQITFDEDYNVPDAKADVGRMIQKKGEVEIGDIALNDGRARITGRLIFHLLYVSDGENRRICALTGDLPILETINLEGVEGGDKICLKWELEDLNIHLINSRKLNIRSVVTFHAHVEELGDIQVPIDVREEKGISQKRRDLNVMELGVQKKDTLRIKKEITLASNKPSIHEILWKEIEVRGLDLRAEEGKVTAKGELFIFCLYAGDDEDHPLQWLEQAIPFSGEVECAGCMMDMIPKIETTCLQNSMEIQPDADGEERMLQVDVVLEMDIRLYSEGAISILEDVYTPEMECVPVRKEETLESLLIRNSSKCRVSDRVQAHVPQNKILQICHSEGTIRLDEDRIVENGIEVQGIVELRILYIVSDDDMPFYATEAAIPFRHVIEAQGIGKECRYYLQNALEQLSTTMTDGNEIEVKVVMNLGAIVRRLHTIQAIQTVEERMLDQEKIQNMPGIVCYVVQPGDTLWDIARNFYTTVDQIRKINGLKSEEIVPMQQLILAKFTNA
ncbi:MAG: DUF3794 domain-containing protein [Fusicatenibacter sp.]|nr:DUF3794 domain-containing protein [Fusicatenibacter sp.]MDY2937175.1 DUF3794 domain-containing protein [Fusicatenibacter sp.]